MILLEGPRPVPKYAHVKILSTFQLHYQKSPPPHKKSKLHFLDAKELNFIYNPKIILAGSDFGGLGRIVFFFSYFFFFQYGAHCWFWSWVSMVVT